MKIEMMGAVVRPGDTLVIAVDRRLNAAEVDQLRKQALANLPGVKIAVVDSCNGLVVYRPSETGEAA